MSLTEIAIACIQALAVGNDSITLVLPKFVPARNGVFPRGELLCENKDGERVYRYDAVRMLRKLRRVGVEVRMQP